MSQETRVRTAVGAVFNSCVRKFVEMLSQCGRSERND